MKKEESEIKNKINDIVKCCIDGTYKYVKHDEHTITFVYENGFNPWIRYTLWTANTFKWGCLYRVRYGSDDEINNNKLFDLFRPNIILQIKFKLLARKYQKDNRYDKIKNFYNILKL